LVDKLDNESFQMSNAIPGIFVPGFLLRSGQIVAVIQSGSLGTLIAWPVPVTAQLLTSAKRTGQLLSRALLRIGSEGHTHIWSSSRLQYSDRGVALEKSTTITKTRMQGESRSWRDMLDVDYVRQPTLDVWKGQEQENFIST
jgi:hypothetical protein